MNAALVVDARAVMRARGARGILEDPPTDDRLCVVRAWVHQVW
jgi:hypothetical protein